MKRLIRYWLPALCALLLIFADQFTKYLITSNLQLYDSIPVIPDVFEIHYIRNSGTVWGILSGMNMHTFFVLLTIVMVAVMIYAYVKLAADRKFLPLNITIVILFAGAIGNMIDRIRYHYVVDFLYFKLINFPVFNVADIYVVISIFLLAYLLLFHYKDEDFAFGHTK